MQQKRIVGIGMIPIAIEDSTTLITAKKIDLNFAHFVGIVSAKRRNRSVGTRATSMDASINSRTSSNDSIAAVKSIRINQVTVATYTSIKVGNCHWRRHLLTRVAASQAER